jgi:vanillate O-demethylase ferredoxin subunit
MDVIGVDAEIDHRDVFFGPEERTHNRRVCACVSRVAGGCITVEPAWRGDPDLAVTEVWAGA